MKKIRPFLAGQTKRLNTPGLYCSTCDIPNWANSNKETLCSMIKNYKPIILNHTLWQTSVTCFALNKSCLFLLYYCQTPPPCICNLDCYFNHTHVIFTVICCYYFIVGWITIFCLASSKWMICYQSLHVIQISSFIWCLKKIKRNDRKDNKEVILFPPKYSWYRY